MKTSICRFMPPQKESDGLSVITFVYETEIKKFKRPLLYLAFHASCVTEGRAILHMAGKSYPLERGDLFFTFPDLHFDFTEEENFSFIYVSFVGEYGKRLLSDVGINYSNAVFPKSEYIALTFEDNIRRITPKNSSLLTQSTLLAALAYAKDNIAEKTFVTSSDTLTDSVKNYIEVHYCDSNLTLSLLSKIFKYSSKYISAKFKSINGIGISEYICELRIKRAVKLMESGSISVSDIALNCGFSDPLYFSKVFKKKYGVCPTEYLQGMPKSKVAELITKYVYTND